MSARALASMRAVQATRDLGAALDAQARALAAGCGPTRAWPDLVGLSGAAIEALLDLGAVLGGGAQATCVDLAMAARHGCLRAEHAAIVEAMGRVRPGKDRS